MSKIDRKLQQIRLQHKILNILQEDNGVSCHFDFHVNLISDDETVKLNLLTYNPKHDEYMLLHTIKATSSLACLQKMLVYIESLHNNQTMYSYTITWTKKGLDETHTSYFTAPTALEAEKKFLHEKNKDDYDFTILQNPIA
jgi:hypothetical protein